MKTSRKACCLMSILLMGGVVNLLAGCGGESRALLPGGGGPSEVVWNDPSKTPSRQVEGATFVGNAVCLVCHTEIHEEYSTGNNETSNAHGKDFHNTPAGDLIDGRGGACAPCHTTGYDEPGGYNAGGLKNRDLEGIGCEECHGPGSEHVVSQSPDDIVGVPDARATCQTCHVRSYKQSLPQPPVTDADLANVAPGRISVHHPQAVAFYGGSGYEFFPHETYPRSRHFDIANTCVTCHLQGDFAEVSPGGRQLDRGHGKESLKPDENTCLACHVNDVSLSRMLAGTQKAIEELLIQLGGADPTNPNLPDPNAGGGALQAYADAHGLKVGPSDPNPAPDDPKIAQYRVYKGARYNFFLVEEDKSQGVHNYPYFQRLLKDSINALKVPG
jgi:hypothetical protein